MKHVRTVIVGLVLVMLIVGYYYYINVKTNKASSEDVVLTEVDNCILKDLDKDYPKTPREVVKMYDRIMMCLYNEEYTDEEFYKLADQQRKLLDDELQEQNPIQIYYNSLLTTVTTFKENSGRIITAKECASNDVETRTIQGKECAYVTVSYFTEESSEFNKSYQEYVVRKSDDGRWGIVAFRITDNPDE